MSTNVSISTDEPKYWVLNPLNRTFNLIPKKRKGLINDPVCMKEDDFVLGHLAWIPRRISFLQKFTNKLSRRLSSPRYGHK
jgi:hypothetical protein